MMESESSHSPNGDDSTRQLLEDRRRNDLKLKGRLEHIFDKYTRDFSRIGDEIDLETGEIIVNNGHLAQMQNERDVGSTTSLRFAKAVVAELDADDNGPVAFVGEDSDQDELSIDRVLGITPVRQKVRTSIEEEPESEGHAGDNEDSGDETEEYRPDSDQEEGDMTESDEEEDISDQETTQALTQGILTNLPAIQDSLASLSSRPSHPDQRHVIDTSAIQALGQNIADQIAQFLKSSTNLAIASRQRGGWTIPPLGRDVLTPQRHGASEPRNLTSPSPFVTPGAALSLWAQPKGRGPYKRRKIQHDDSESITRNPRSRNTEGAAEVLGGRADDPPSFLQNANDNFRMLAFGINKQATLEEPTYGVQSTDFSTDTSRPYYEPLLDDSDAGLGRSNNQSSDHNNNRNNIGNKKRTSVPSRQPYTTWEDATIMKLREVDGLYYRDMEVYLPGRTASSLQHRYKKLLAEGRDQRPVVKREIVEILDDDDNDDDHDKRREATAEEEEEEEEINISQPFPTPTPTRPNFVTFPMSPPFNPFAPTRPGQPPLLRQALEHNLYNPTGSGYYPPYPAFGTPFASRTGDVEGSDAHNGPPAKRQKKSSKRTEYAPRYNCFDTTQGNGRFGVLRADKKMPQAAIPEQEQLLGPVTSRSGTFGVLRMGKTAKPRKRSTKKSVHPASPVPRQEAQPTWTQREETPSAYGAAGNIYRHSNNLPYFTAQNNAATNSGGTDHGPQGRPQLNRPPHTAVPPIEIDDDNSDSALFMTPREMSYEPVPVSAAFAAMSPTPLPTPPSDGSAHSSTSIGLGKEMFRNNTMPTGGKPFMPPTANRMPPMSSVSLSHVTGAKSTPARASSAARGYSMTPTPGRVTPGRFTPGRYLGAKSHANLARASPSSQLLNVRPPPHPFDEDSGDELA